MSINQKQLGILANEVFKSLADINADFMKSCFTIKEIPTDYKMEIFWKCHQQGLRVMEQIQFYFEHV